jgi:hypothetical protein
MVRDELGILSLAKVFEIFEVVHKGFIFKIFALSEDYVKQFQ